MLRQPHPTPPPNLPKRGVQGAQPHGAESPRGRAALSAAGGFTLVEIMVVLFIVGLLLAVVGPRVGSGLSGVRDREFAQGFVDTLRRTRIQAMTQGQLTAFRIDPEHRRYGVGATAERPIPENVEVFAENAEQDPRTGEFLLSFYPDGSHTGRRLELVFDGARSFVITLNPLTGTASYERRTR